jgi:signal transduction histidine kinase
VRALRPEQLEQANLVEALGDLIDGWSQQSEITADLDVVSRPVPASADTEAAVFRITQEALTNVAKHAGATKVRVTLTYLDDALLLDVADNGVGFSAGAPGSTTDGYGLLGMRRRAEGVGGRLTIESVPGSGATVNLLVPVAPIPVARSANC